MLKKALREDRTSQASPVLRELLRGHMISLWFCAGHQATRMLELAVRAGASGLESRSSPRLLAGARTCLSCRPRLAGSWALAVVSCGSADYTRLESARAKARGSLATRILAPHKSTIHGLFQAGSMRSLRGTCLTAKGAVRLHEKGMKGPPTTFAPCWQVAV